jgi:predicted nucleic acid-binding protein
MGRLMLPPRQVYLDTNYFIAMLEPADAALGALLTQFYSLNDGSSKPYLATSELTLAELLVGPYKKNDSLLAQTYENMFTPGGVIEIAPIDRNVLRQAAMLRSRQPHMKLPDAIHMATAFALKCRHFVTFDLRISAADEAVGRVDEGEAPDELEIVQPTPENLHILIETFGK